MDARDTLIADRIDLATPAGRRRARRELVWGDHGFLRARFRNLHQISDEMWRCNQPSPEHLQRYRDELGIKTVVNLRGPSKKGYYLLEREACERLGMAMVDFQVFSREAPSPEAVMGARKLFDEIAYPAIMHCKSGADRAGVMSVLYMHFRQGQPIEKARQQLSFKYLHVQEGKTGVLDFFFRTYLTEGPPKGLSFMEWVQRGYDPKEVRRRFRATLKSRLNIDRLLRRE